MTVTQNKVKRLSDIISMDDYVKGLEDIVWSGEAIIDKGFYLEIYINSDGVIPNEDSEITSNGYSCFRYINQDVTLDELLTMDDFSEGLLRKFTMTITVIPNKDPLFARKREMCIPLFERATNN